MFVKLKDLKPNPLRDFRIDPLEDARVAMLRASIKDDGFWGGVVCRETDDGLEVAAGWHRVQAALAAGIREADVFVADTMDDATMVRIYTRENTTQRGNSATALAGSVAAAVRIIAKSLMTGNLSPLGERFTKRAMDTAAGNLSKGAGIGQDMVEELLKGIPGISGRVVEEQLAALKASSAYTRILEEIQEAIAVEHKERLKKAERAEQDAARARLAFEKAEAERKAAAVRAKAAKEDSERKAAEMAKQRAEIIEATNKRLREEAQQELDTFKADIAMRDRSAQAVEHAQQTLPTLFDLDVQTILTIPSHVATFRRLATSPGYRDSAPVKRQVAIARDIVALAKELQEPLTEAFISRVFHDTARHGRQEVAKKAHAAKEQARRHATQDQQYRSAVDEFERGCRIMITAGQRLISLEQAWKGDRRPSFGASFIATMKLAQKIITRAANTFTG